METLINLLIWLLVFGLLAAIAMWVLRLLGIPENILRIVMAILALIALLVLLGAFTGHVPFPVYRR